MEDALTTGGLLLRDRDSRRRVASGPSLPLQTGIVLTIIWSERRHRLLFWHSYATWQQSSRVIAGYLRQHGIAVYSNGVDATMHLILMPQL